VLERSPPSIWNMPQSEVGTLSLRPTTVCVALLTTLPVGGLCGRGGADGPGSVRGVCGLFDGHSAQPDQPLDRLGLLHAVQHRHGRVQAPKSVMINKYIGWEEDGTLVAWRLDETNIFPEVAGPLTTDYRP
jgi:hypothetical protein